MKKLFFILSSLLIISLLITACRKDPLDAIGKDEARMHGKIIEKGSKKPIKGARVYLRNCKCIFLGGCNCKVIDSLTTDDTGRYDFTYKYNGFDGHSFDIFVRVPEKFRQDNSPAALSPNTHDIVNYDVEIIPRAWIKIHVKNIKPFDEFDKVWVFGGWSGGSHDNIYYGKNTDLIVKKEVVGNDSTSVSWDVTKNKIDYFTTKKVYCFAHDTLNFELLY
jgi:hypothetical protein